MGSQQELQLKLNALRNQERIDLIDEYIGDQGAKILADFLRNNNNLRVLTLKGNDIGLQGVQQIFHSLQPLPNIQSVIFEWNNLGIQQEGINAVAGFLLGNKSIQHIGLSNNKIQGQDIDQLVNAFSASNILSVDLKWNTLGTQGGQKINRMLEQNKKIIYMQITGNNIAEDIVDQIEQKIMINKKSNNVELQKIMGTAESEQLINLNTTEKLPPQIPGTHPHKELHETTGINKIHHLENVLQQEKLYTNQIKQKLEMELEGLQRKEANDQRTYQDLEQKISDIQNQNKMMVFDVDRLKNEFTLIEKSNKEQIKGHEDRITKNKNLIYEMEKKHKINCEQLLQDYNMRIKDLSRDWENRCRVIEERTKVLELEKQNQNEQLKKVEEKQIDLKIKQEQELQQLSQRVQEDILQKYQSNLQNLQAKIQAIEESHDIYLKRNGEMIQEYEKREQEAQVELDQYKQELQRLEDENDTFVHNNNTFKVTNEKLKSELQIKENNVAQLESEINSLNQQIENKKHYGKQNLENIKVDNQKERKQWEDQREEQVLTISELENKLREAHLDNSRLRQEYMKLSQIVQANVNREIFSTFQKNNYY